MRTETLVAIRAPHLGRDAFWTYDRISQLYGLVICNTCSNSPTQLPSNVILSLRSISQLHPRQCSLKPQGIAYGLFGAHYQTIRLARLLETDHERLRWLR